MKAMIDDPSHFSIATLKKISLARAFCVEADYYILDDPFSEIDNKTAQAVETKLR
jgi:ABC-type Mn2+/Zn2+ transport system ATPase subunit